jgi:uncharacterized membrane protein (DUF4010 family)
VIAGLAPWAAQAMEAGAGLAIGILVGLERGFRLRRVKAGTRVAGVRTFSLVGLAAALAGIVGQQMPIAAAVLLAAIAAPLAVAYAPQLKEERDSTTAVAAAATLAAAFLAGLGNIGLALAAAAIIVLVLAMRDEIHRFVERMDASDIRALARYGVNALAVLPFLPDRSMGPYGAWNPSQLWWVVILVTGFSFLGYVANRIFGAERGTIATALIGGAYSSTAVTQSLAQRLGAGQGGGPEPAGIALATAVMYLRVIVLVAILSPRLLWPFVQLVAPALVVAWIAGGWLFLRSVRSSEATPPGNPIALVPAIGFVAFVAIAAVAARWAETRFGEQGIAWLLFFMGAMDVDAAIVTAGGLPASAIGPELAAIAIAGTIIANMGVKIGVTLAYARTKGLVAAAALLASVVALALSIAVIGLRG